MSDLKARIKAANDRPLEAVGVPEWDVTIYFRPMSLRERLDLQGLIGESGTIQFSRLLARSLHDENGERIFTDDEAAILEDKHPDVVGRLGEHAMAFHKLRPEDTDAAAKNSEPSPSD